MGFFKKKKNILPPSEDHIEANLANSTVYVRDLQKIYPSAKGDVQAMKDVNINVMENEFVSIVGPSGCGKSTLLKSLNRMNDLVEGCKITGQVTLDGTDIYRDLDVNLLRKRVGMVFQKPNPFPMSIYDNVAYGPRTHGIRSKAKLDQIVEEALRGAAIWDELKDRLKKSALGLSGGQQQRLCIARALLKKPKVLILDDSTSAVDTATDAKIRTAFREEIPDTTQQIIAQRISSVQDADRIIVMEDGKVNGFGTHEELLEQNDIYREVYESQTSGGGDFDEKEGK